VSAFLLALVAPGAYGQTFPNRPLRIIDAFPAGGASDFLARTIGSKLSESLGQPVLIENRPGAAGTIGTHVAAKSPPDGHTLLMGISSAIAASTSLYSKLPYDVSRDFAPVTRVAAGGYVLVAHPSLPVKSIKELVALAKARPGQIKYASAGTGSGAHLCGALFRHRAAIDLAHVPYKGGAPLMTAVVSGESEVGCMTVATGLAQINAGRLRPLAVTSAKRTPALAHVPTVAESGYPAAEITITFGLYAPAATPKNIIALLNSEVRKILEMADVRERIAAQGVVANGSTPEELGAIIAAEIAQWAEVIKAAGIRLD
jgi:tripartite-type tricarboxylate transporter receptor subunit TctC